MSKTGIRAIALAVLLFSFPAMADLKPLHGLAMHGEPKYAADFQHFEYANPDAPKGGEMRLASQGTFDSLNGYTIKGMAAPGLGMIYQTLMINADDEAFSEYGLIAETVEMPDDRSYVVFNLRKEAKWHDGKKLTADDVVWTFNTLMKDGHPFYRAYYGHVKEAKAETPHRVRFTFDMTGNRELPLIMGQMPVLPEHYWAGKDFAATTLTPPPGSGPYKIKSVDSGRKIVYERVKDWWAKDLPVARGLYNFDIISYDLFRDETVLLQALFSGNYDFRAENSAKNWQVEYNGPAVKNGQLVKEEIEHDLPAGMQAFVYNTRRAIFADAKTREALNYAFDFEWSNRQFAYGTYKRNASYFENSELAAKGLPEGKELALLETFRGKIPDALFTTEYKNPVTDGSGGGVRQNLGRAKALLTEAGWVMGKSGLLERNGQKLKFEILINSPIFDRWINPFIGNMKKLGIEVRLRVVDTAQYQNRMDSFDFDMTVSTFGQSMSPGNEQYDFWGSAKADVNGSRNIIGVKNPVIDALIEKVVTAPDRDSLIAASRALDRVLLWNYYVIPQWYYDRFRIAYWNKFGHPEVTPKYGLSVPDSWWYDAAKAVKISTKAPPAGK